MKEYIKYRLLCIATVTMLLLTGLMLAELLAENNEDGLQTYASRFYASGQEAVEEIVIAVEEPAEKLEAEVPEYFVLERVDSIRVVITNKETGGIYHENIQKWKGNHGYRGEIEIIEADRGYVVINELPLEEYLYSVVPSEMPAGYPMEALKAQAICARTYAYLHVLSPAYPEWNAHVDDTTAFQVYHSVEEQESTTQAVIETTGMVLLAPDGRNLAETYYYSTSCGYGSDAKVWRSKYSDNYPYLKSKRISTETVSGGVVEAMAGDVSIQEGVHLSGEYMKDDLLFEEYIKSTHEMDLESDEGWYRWSYEVDSVDVSHMLKNLKKRYEVNPELILTLEGGQYVSKPIEELDTLVDVQIDKRGSGGVADELLIITEKNVYKVITELNIRYVLNDGKTMVCKQDGAVVSMPSLLPSAFISIENQYEDGELTGYRIFGGGFGHGAGMSQNAAKAMAQEGMRAEEILGFFFVDCALGRSEEEGVMNDR